MPSGVTNGKIANDVDVECAKIGMTAGNLTPSCYSAILVHATIVQVVRGFKSGQLGPLVLVPPTCPSSNSSNEHVS